MVSDFFDLLLVGATVADGADDVGDVLVLAPPALPTNAPDADCDFDLGAGLFLLLATGSRLSCTNNIFHHI
jgi:hypothetical protein